MVIATGLILTQLGCASTTPRQHWWEFWRPKKRPASEEMQPISYEIPGETPGYLDPDEVAPISEPLPLDRVSITDEEYANLMDQPIGEPLREPATEEARLQAIRFGFDRYDLDAEAIATLEANMDWLRRHPGTDVQIEGHTDERGTIEYNLLLGERRAKAVKAYLVSRGVAGDRLHPISYGEERPVDSGSSESAYSRNRRAQFLAY
jgi:peptidoglycan-associated lipoprotein